ncbi:MAG: BMP family ABC transporter substrate-binding protein [Acidimicrobiales bacterium]|nr:BMP family ABC transporter substrate-binding protein [Acidimicrobiales bacterium]
MSKRTQKLLAVVLGSALVFSACGSDTEEAEPAATTAAPAAAAAATTTAAPAPAPAEAVSVGLVFDIGGRGDQSFNDATYAGLVRAQDELGANISDVAPNSDGSNRAELLRLQADDNDLVIGVGFLFADTMTEVAAEYPDTSFAIIDGWVEAPNVASLGFAEHEGSFLVGAAAGLKSESDTIGFIGGVSIDLIGKFEAGFIAGVAATNPDANVLSEYISEPPDFSGFNAPDRGREIAQSMYEKGADIVYHAAGGSGGGLFEAAKSFSEESGSKVWAIGVDADQYLTSDEAVRDYIMTSMLKRVDVAVYNTIKDLGEGNFVAGGQSFDLSVDGVGYSTTGGFIDDIVDDLEDLKAKIVSGAISVPTEPGERAVVLPDLGGRTVTIAVDNAYLPFSYIPADTGVAEGWDYDAIGEICTRINCVPSFQEFVWDGTIIATGEGQFNMAAGGITITEERDKIVDFSDSFISTDQKILIQKDNTEIGSRADLEGSDCNVGSMTGTTNYDLSVDVVGEARIVAFESFAFAVQALITGDVCAVIMDDVAGQGYQGENADQVSMVDEVLTSDPLGFAFTEGSDLVAPFNAAIQSMKDDGTLAALNTKYFGTAFTITYDDIGDGAYAYPMPPTPTLVPAAVFKPSLEKSYEVSVEEAIVYGTGGTLDGGQVELLLDLAIPDTGTDGPRPLFVHIHGGSFQTGSRWPQLVVAERGWVAASIDYRLAGDEPLPGLRVKPFFDAVGGESSSARNRSVVGSMEDTLVALDYLLSRADELNIDTDRIVLKGESAGAFIALSVAYCADKFENSGPRIAAVIDFAGGISEIFCGGGTAIDPDEAAVFIAHGTADATVSFTDRALSIVDGATAAGITYELHPLEGVGHDWLLGLLGQTNADGRKIDDLMYEFLDRVLYGE